jgi:hypothetical protein
VGTVFQGDVQTELGPGHRVTRHWWPGPHSLERTSPCSSKRLASINSRYAQTAATQCGLPEPDHQTANCQRYRRSNVGHAAFRLPPKLSSKSARNGAPHANSCPKRWRAPPSFGGMAAEIVERVVSPAIPPPRGDNSDSSACPGTYPAGAFFGQQS